MLNDKTLVDVPVKEIADETMDSWLFDFSDVRAADDGSR
jgi:hypothetical protein